jgi:hypothetical protein
MSESDLAHWTIEAGLVPKVILNGLNISAALSGFQLQVQTGEIPRLILRTKPGAGPIKGAGVVTVESVPEEAIRRAILMFLETVDPEELDKKMLDGLGMGDTGSLTHQVLMLLKERVK